MKRTVFHRIKAFLLFAGWMGLLVIPFRIIWDGIHPVTYFLQCIVFMVIVFQSFFVVEIGLGKKVRYGVVRVLRRKPVINRILFGRRWRLDRQFMAVTDGSREIVVSRLISGNTVYGVNHLTVYRRQLDFRYRVIDRYVIFIRMVMIAIELGLLFLVTRLPHV